MKHLLLLGALVVGLFPVPAFTAQTQNVQNPAVDYAVEQSIMFRSEDGDFHGNGSVTRLEFTLAAINHLYGNANFERCYSDISPSQPVSYEKLFSDVARTDWYGKQLCVGMHAGVIQGNTDGSFRPFATVTTAEASKILAKAYGLAYGTDAGKAWYTDAMSALSMRGAIAKSAIAGKPVTREDMAKMFYGLRNVPRLTFTPMMTNMQGQGTPSTTEPTAPVAAPSPYNPTMPTPAAVPTVRAVTMDEGCIAAMTGPGSPGVAMMVLGQPALVRSLTRNSHRVLREKVEAAYENGTFAQRSSGILSRCKNTIVARSPGAAVLLLGAKARPDVVQRIPNRILQQQAYADRTHTSGVQIKP